jgi:hypothetical protein
MTRVVIGSNSATKGDTREPRRAKADTVLRAVALCVVGNRSKEKEIDLNTYTNIIDISLNINQLTLT